MNRTSAAKKVAGGILLVNKRTGLTSHDVVDRARRILREKKIGHTGTLDPRAEGLLVLCVGGATRFASFLANQDKTYRAVIRLGRTTATDDSEGEVLSSYEGDLAPLVGEKRLEQALDSFAGLSLQVPPSYSAKKIGGVPAYVLARRGEKPRLKPVAVRIGSIRLLRFELPELELEVDCSAGTYLRSLARDLGEKLGCGGYLCSLVRTRVGDFTLDSAATLEELRTAGIGEIERKYLRPIESGLAGMPAVELTVSGVEKVYFGRLAEMGRDCSLLPEPPASAGVLEVRMQDGRGRFLGIGRLERIGTSMGVLQPKRLMVEAFPFDS
ncbi:MAG: tRNA pseudouridine(55) synthase TruB [Candidatus Glassbacteria bacterium RIFCSPLOWO2_12_FULL_58_11]|uniref:tRNA pseudouridine synthase B n=1 Tax=Candidatus Glassbacteria bacterium RIFCSPLOWO2_12_FULL_58_11 TaxID=1817867 RepID=A0A1F5YQ57_9BACT|nr:MAG: tRNA pseudouridine(55) synthase TruB [Candidatus Glassbacteria bacterium RIFCSPLOWO2_12_FULL_58_11]